MKTLFSLLFTVLIFSQISKAEDKEFKFIKVINSDQKTFSYKPPEPISNWKFGANIGLTLNSQMKGSSTRTLINNLGTTSTDLAISDKTQGWLQLGFFVSNLPSHSSGFIGSLDFIPMFSDNLDYFNFFTAIGKINYAYRFQNLYSFIGANYSVNESTKEKIEAGVGNSMTSSVRGGIGGQVGLGYLITEDLALDLEYQVFKLDYDIRIESSNSVQKFKMDSYIHSLNLATKFYF